MDREIEDELHHYLELAIAERIARGLSPEEAKRAASLEIGGLQVAKDTIRDGTWDIAIETLLRDLRYAVRSLARTPSFTITAIVTLALGVGANTAMFSVVNAVMLRPLPYADPDRLATLWTDDPRHGSKEEGTSQSTFLEWRARSRSFTDMAVVSRGRPTMLGGSEPERLAGEDISVNLLPLLGAQPVIGRNLTSDEEFSGRVAILSHGLWQRRFGGRRDIVGSAIQLDGRAVTVIGVMPAAFFFPRKTTQLWLSSPLSERERTERALDTWRVIGRLKSGVSFASAQREMTAIGEQLATEFPVSDAGFAGYGVNVVPMLTQVIGSSLPFALYLLLGAVALVLAIACVNVANLLLVRGTMRGREMAIRTALGASRGRLMRQLVAESLLLSVTGAGAGLALSVALTRLVSALAANLPRIDETHLDGRVLAFTVAVSIVGALAFGLVPAWRTTRRDAIETLRDGERRIGASPSVRRLRRLLVVSECALAVVLSSGATLLIRSVGRLGEIDPGFRAENALLLRVALPERERNRDEERRNGGDERMAQLIERLRHVPGVRSAGAVRDFVFDKNPDWIVTTQDGLSTADVRGELTSEYVTPAFFAAVGATLVAGREFDATDLGSPVGVINETFARRYFPGATAIGRRFKQGGPQSGAAWRTVVGIVRDIHRGGLERAPLAEFYTPWYAPNMDVVIRAEGDPVSVAASIRRMIRDDVPSAAVGRLLPLGDEFSATGAQRRLNTQLLTGFAMLALLMSVVGIYGVMHSLVTTRTREIGIRIALGARVSHAVALVLKEGMVVAGGGVVLGMLATVPLTAVMSGLVFGIGPRDPASIVSGGAALVLAALIACWVPARRAARVDPMTALRQD